MKKQDLVMIVSAAVGAATVTVFALWPGPMEAGPEQEAAVAKTAKPTLAAQGAEFRLQTAGGRTFKAGEEPVFELQARNTTDRAVDVPVLIAMTSTAPADMMSRAPMLPALIWQEVQPVVLKPGESKVLTVAAKAKLPAKTVINVSLQEAPPAEANAGANQQVKAALSVRRLFPGGITMVSFSTAAPSEQPALVSVK